MTEKLFSIGDVVKITGFTYRTIRYYDEIGLVKPIWSEDGRKRCYSKDAINKFLLTKRLKDLGFPLEKIKETIEQKKKITQDAPPREFAPYLLNMLEEQYLIAQEKAERFTKLANLLEKMLDLTRTECMVCDKQTCEGQCHANRFLDPEDLFDENEFEQS